MPKQKNERIRVSRAKVTDDDRTIYSVLREEFAASDLQKYAETEPMVPAEQVLLELEKAHRKTTAKKKVVR